MMLFPKNEDKENVPISSLYSCRLKLKLIKFDNFISSAICSFIISSTIWLSNCLISSSSSFAQFNISLKISSLSSVCVFRIYWCNKLLFMNRISCSFVTSIFFKSWHQKCRRIKENSLGCDFQVHLYY